MNKGKGGSLHRRCVEWIETMNRTPDTIVTRERILGGVKLVDVLIYSLSSKTLVGVEVQLRATNHALHNVEADLAAGCDEVLIASPYRNVLERIRGKIESMMPWFRERVDYLHIEFIPQKKKNNSSATTRNKTASGIYSTETGRKRDRQTRKPEEGISHGKDHIPHRDRWQN